MTVTPDVGEVRDGEDEGGDPDEDRPEGDENICQGGVGDRGVAAYVFEDVEPVSLNDYSCKVGG